MIGNDFPPNDFTLLGLTLTDPTDFIYDIVMGILSLIFAFKLNQGTLQNKFSKSWFKFFLVFGWAAMFAAFGHLFYNYFHYYGKLIGWLLIPISIYWIEIAMIEPHWNNNLKLTAKKLYRFKLFLLYSVFVALLFLIDGLENPQLLFLPIAINSIIGLLIGVGVFSYQFKNKISKSFNSIFLGIVVIFPSAFIFIFKINLHPWFSKNDFSHVLMIIGIIFFFLGVKKIMTEDHSFLKIN